MSKNSSIDKLPSGNSNKIIKNNNNSSKGFSNLNISLNQSRTSMSNANLNYENKSNM